MLALVSLALACRPAAREAAARSVAMERVVPLSAIHGDDGATIHVHGRAAVHWIDDHLRPPSPPTDARASRAAALVVGGDTSITFRVDEVRGLRLRGAYGLLGDQRSVEGHWTAVFRVSLQSAAGEERLLHEDRVPRDDPRPLRRIDLEAPRSWTGAGEIRLDLDFDGPPPPWPAAAWIEPELVLPFELPVHPAAAPWNLVLVTSDTTRKDVLGAYGGPARTPALERLAADGILFREAHSAGYGTAPSHASLFTGSSPNEHGVFDNETVLDDGHETLAEALLGAGYRTAAFVSARPVSRALGLDQGFLLYDDVWGMDLAGALGQYGRHERRGAVSVDRLLAWLGGTAEPFAAWLHLFDPHQPYAPPGGAPEGEPTEITRLFEDEQGRPRYLHASELLSDPQQMAPEALDRAARRRYTAEIEAVDTQLGRVLEALRRRGLYDRSLVVFVSDHGENFLDRGAALAYRHPGLHSEVTRLALVLKLPESRHAGGERGFLLLNSDLPCTIAEALGLDRPSAWSCESFLPLLGREGDPAFRSHLVLQGAARQETAIRTGQWLYREVRPDLERRPELLRSIGFDPHLAVQLFDLHADPLERENLVRRADLADIVRRFHALVVEASDGAIDQGRRVDSPEHVEGLKALGYLD